MRHLAILLAIIFTYTLPSNHHEGSVWFVFQVIPSTILVAFLYFWQYFSEDKYIDYVIGLEVFATFCNLIACLQYGLSFKTAFIYSQYEHIMTSVFIAELAITGVVMLDGIRQSIPILRIPHFDNRKPKRSALFSIEAIACTIR